jgi:hypothetical protein
MASELEQLNEELKKNGERRKELRAKIRDPKVGMAERALANMQMDELEEREHDLARLIQQQENIAKHDELIAEAQRLGGEIVKLTLEVKDKSAEEKEAGDKKLTELTAAMNKALADAEEYAALFEEDYSCTCGDCGECGYGYGSYDHLKGANGYNSY